MNGIPTWVWHQMGFNPSNPWDWINMGFISEEEIEKILKQGIDKVSKQA